MSNYWEGLTKITEVSKLAKARANKGARRGMLIALRNTLDQSNLKVPHEEGDLERDGGISIDEGKLRGAVSYGRSADTKAYAVAQHEAMNYHHDNGRTAKFLENAVNATRADNLAIIAQAIKGELGT